MEFNTGGMKSTSWQQNSRTLLLSRGRYVMPEFSLYQCCCYCEERFLQPRFLQGFYRLINLIVWLIELSRWGAFHWLTSLNDLYPECSRGQRGTDGSTVDVLKCIWVVLCWTVASLTSTAQPCADNVFVTKRCFSSFSSARSRWGIDALFLKKISACTYTVHSLCLSDWKNYVNLTDVFYVMFTTFYVFQSFAYFSML